MVKDISFFDQLSNTILPQESWGQILLEIDEEMGGIEEACEVIRTFQVDIKKTEIFQDPDGIDKVALIAVCSEEVQDIVLKLVEKGFSKIVGLKAMNTE